MPIFAALNGVPVAHGRIYIPATGMIVADVVLVSATDPTGPQTLVFAGLTIKCAVHRAINWVGVRGVRLIGGAGGWRQPLPPKPYQSTSQILTSTIVSDAAASVGELPPQLAIDLPVGQTWIRVGGKASNVLNDLLKDGWWMDPAGIVQTKPRDATLISSDYVVTRVQGAPGRYVVASEAPEDWMPGRKFQTTTAQNTVSRVMHTIEPKAVKTEVLSP